ncbi:hypothetical protein ACHAW5_001111 [Stephanodiscus triporus]|uniref:Uncharacterized protein n=1 Tax=Stephanodiscus triporus TaxID=2934178 RepID=A0ABD3PD04_9STRA
MAKRANPNPEAAGKLCQQVHRLLQDPARHGQKPVHDGGQENDDQGSIVIVAVVVVSVGLSNTHPIGGGDASARDYPGLGGHIREWRHRCAPHGRRRKCASRLLRHH